MFTRKYVIMLVFWVIFVSCCEEQSMQADFKQTRFGLSNKFYGWPNPYQRKNLPQAMRGAYYIESVRDISMPDLAEMLSKKQLIAEELKNGQHYIAMRGSKIVQFDTFVSGLVIIIERYRIVDD